MPPRTIFMEGFLNKLYWGVDGLNKKPLKYQGRGVLMATKDIHRGSIYGVDYRNPEFCLV